MEESNSNELFNKKQIEPSDDRTAYNIYQGEMLVAEVRGTDPSNQTIIPKRVLSDYEESKLFEYASNIGS
ncbi:hypothetical protein [Lentibacillus sp. Marseille-P4043]|uniref:hypothetical protein n=1 Tax=Lentibacillus sp. Marseille-P4043 TaxID=2040293 RepID=UPI000D0ABB9A|nr:hypothetical protein [Lentibacillus sp. Marseille-P4043]